MISRHGSQRTYTFAMVCVIQCMINSYVLCFVAITHIAYTLRKTHEIAPFMVAKRIFLQIFYFIQKRSRFYETFMLSL